MGLPVRVLEYPVGRSSREWGRIHGESFKDQIRELAAIRIGLTVRFGDRLFRNENDVLEVAEAHLPLLQAADENLYQEVLGIAEGAGCDPAHVVIINHYTDLRDIDPQTNPPDKFVEPSDEGCTVVYAPTNHGPLLGQTWDTHASAASYLMMLGVPMQDLGDKVAPAGWFLTIVGCVGMAGMNARGVGLTINNLKSRDAKYGVIWPAIVRKAMRESSAQAATDVVRNSRVGSGHSYIIAGPDGCWGLETSGHRQSVVFDNSGGAFHHTNHCLMPEIAEVSWDAPTSTTWVRYDAMEQSLGHKPVADLDDLWQRLGTPPVGQPLLVDQPTSIGTCATVAFDLEEHRGLASPGPAGAYPVTTFGFGDAHDLVVQRPKTADKVETP